MDVVIGTNNVVEALFNQIARLKYTVEEFFVFNPELNQVVPFGEMLARDPVDGSPKGHLFDEARQCGQIVKADLQSLEGAIKQHLALGKSNSINLNAETFFSPELIVKLDELKAKYPQLDPDKLWLEITEQGGVPMNASHAALEAVKQRRYRLALDDYDIDNPKERARLDVFGPHVGAVKLDHSYADAFRFGSQATQQGLSRKIHAMKDEFPGMIVVLEGVRGSDVSLYPTLYKAGVEVAQQSGYRDDGPVKAIDRNDIELALHL